MKLLLKLSFHGFWKRYAFYLLGALASYVVARFLFDDYTDIAGTAFVANLLLLVRFYAHEQIYNRNSVWIRNLPVKRSELVSFVFIRNILSLGVIFFTLIHSNYLVGLSESYLDPSLIESQEIEVSYFSYIGSLFSSSINILFLLWNWLGDFSQNILYSPLLSSSSLLFSGIGVALLLSTTLYTGNGFLKNLAGKQKIVKMQKPSTKDKLIAISLVSSMLLLGCIVVKLLGDTFLLSVVFFGLIFSFFYFLKTTFVLENFPFLNYKFFALGALLFYGLVFSYSHHRYSLPSISAKQKFGEVSNNRLMASKLTNKDVNHFFKKRVINHRNLSELLSVLSLRDNVDLLDFELNGIPNYGLLLEEVEFKNVFSRWHKKPERFYSLFDPRDLSLDDIKLLVDSVGGEWLYKARRVSKSRIENLAIFLSYRDFKKGEIFELARSNNPNSIYLALLLNHEYDPSVLYPSRKTAKIEKRKVLGKHRFDLSPFVRINKDKLGLNISETFLKSFKDTRYRSVSSISSQRDQILYAKPKYYQGYFYLSGEKR